MKHHVLVVEDEAAILRGVLRTIDRDPALRGSGCSSVDEAVGILTGDPPELLVTDLNMPGRHGLEMINELEKAHLAIPIIITTAYRAAFEPYFPHHRELTVLEKPVSTTVLLEEIHRKLQAMRTTPIGPTFQVADYLQLAAMGRYSVVLRVSLDEGDEGWLEIVAGDVWNAYYGELTGEEAVAALLTQPANAVATQPMSDRPARRQIEIGTDGLLLDLARQLDEARRDGELDAVETRPTQQQSPAKGYAAAFEEGMAAVRREDWQRAREAFLTALEYKPGDARARHNLERIEQLRGPVAAPESAGHEEE